MKKLDRKRAHKRSTRLTKMLRSTAAASVLEFDQTLSLSGFAWHALLVLSNLRYLKISLVLRRSPDITMHNGNQSQIHTHTYIHATRRQHTEHHLRTSFAGLAVSASALDLTIPNKPTPRSLFAT